MDPDFSKCVAFDVTYDSLRREIRKLVRVLVQSFEKEQVRRENVRNKREQQLNEKIERLELELDVMDAELKLYRNDLEEVNP